MTRVVLAMMLLVVATSAAGASPDVFPLAAGNEWVYHGTLTRVQPQADCQDAAHCKAILTRETLDWTMKVTAVGSAGSYRTALLTGHPGDLIWLQGDPRPGTWLIVHDDDGRYFLLREASGESLADIMNDAAKLRPRLSERNVVLRWPFPDNQRFGCNPDVHVSSQPDRNCWRVAGSNRLSTSRIRGVPAHPASVEYDLEYHTMPEDLTVGFSPRLGFTHFAFHHHGSTYDLELRLVRVTLQREPP